MNPVEFEGFTIEIAKHQSEYLTLPAHIGITREYIITSCWELSKQELEILMETGRIYLQQYTFGGSLQPQRPSVENPIK